MFGVTGKENAHRLRNIKIIVTITASIFATLVAWETLGLPVFATEANVEEAENRVNKKLDILTSTVQSMASFQEDTRAILLNQEWWRVQVKIDSYRIVLSKDPTNLIIREYISNLEKQQQDLKRQISKIIN